MTARPRRRRTGHHPSDQLVIDLTQTGHRSTSSAAPDEADEGVAATG
jgi:hypothetical protein